MKHALGSALGLVLAAHAPWVLAQAPQTVAQCGAIEDDAKRLACYDMLFKRQPEPVEPAEPKAAQPTPPAATEAPEKPPGEETPMTIRQRSVQALQGEWFAITPYRTNYFLPVTWRRNPNYEPYEALGPGAAGGLDDIEAKFQISVQTLLWPSDSHDRFSIWGAFTLQSYWQVYAGDISSPFRETDYEPELIAVWPLQASVGGIKIREAALSLNHQSNGRTEPLSRSWNRVIGRLAFEKGNFGGYTKLWWRIQESAEDDDNPNIERYMGQGEFGLAYKWGVHTFAGILRNNLRADNKSGLQLDWSFPLYAHLKGYVQAYTGYAESLIDGNHYTNRIGLGLMLTDWF